jgi:diguanylate cyclase (GGDEF)-like protein
MESRQRGQESDRSTEGAAHDAGADPADDTAILDRDRDSRDGEAERAAQQRVFDEVLASVELVLVADGAAFWREEADHSLILTASRFISENVLEALDRHVIAPLQSIMQRWPESPLVAVPLNDPTNPIAEEIRSVTETEAIVGLAGVPCRIPGQMLGMLIVVHRKPHPWTVRDLGLATGLAGQLATALQNARLYASIRSLASRLSAIHELSLKLTQLRDVGAIGEAIVAEVGHLVDCDTVRVYRLEPEGDFFRPVAASGAFAGVESPPLETLMRGQTETLPGWVAKRNEPLIIPDASVERRSIFRTSLGPESLLLVPMSYGDAVQGVLVVSKEGVGRYGPDDEQALSIFGRYAAQAIVNADNIEQLERQHTLLERQLAAQRRLLDLSEQLVSTLDPRRVLEQIADTIGMVVRYDRLTIYRLEGQAGGIEPVLSRANSGDTADPPRDGAAFDEGLTSWVIGRGDAVCANDVGSGVFASSLDGSGQTRPGPRASAKTAGRRGEKKRSRTQNMIVVPLRVHGVVVGSLNLTRVGGPEALFSEQEFELCKLFAGQASIALQNAEAHVTMASRADLDALTGLRNHGTFQRDLTSVIEAGKPFSLLMMDLDSFKAFNDTYGHPAGDALLQAVAKAIVSAIRQNDSAYRYGGDEFALLLIGASSSHAEEVATRVRRAVREGVRTSPVGALGSDVGASIGAAHWPADGVANTALVEAADAALYRAKRIRSDRNAADLAAAEPPRRDHSVSDALVEAAHDLAGAATRAEVAQATAYHAAALCGATDTFVAFLHGEPAAAEPEAAARGASSAAPQPRLRIVAASGRFKRRAPTLRSDAGFWRRALDAGSALEEAGPRASLIGAPLAIAGNVAGIVGIVVPAAVSADAMSGLRQLTAVASAAFERTIGSA